MAGNVFVFVGPSVPGALREKYARRVTILPPVAAGDLLRLDARPGDTVGLIDGYFGRRPAVRHKEILALLDNGVAVHGAASMGALRAAELADFGMVGHGRIFADYRSGAIIADDEVALVHSTEQDDYRAYTEALVNIRYALADEVANGTLSERTAAAVLRETGRLPFLERTADNLVAVVGSMGLGVIDAERAEYAIRRAADIKQADALILLEKVSGPRTPPSGRGVWRLQQTAYLRTWQAQARGLPVDDLGSLPDSQVHDLCRVIAADYPIFREQVGQRAVAAAQSDAGLDRWCTAAELSLPPAERTAKAAARALFTDTALAWGDPFLDALYASGVYAEARARLAACLRFHRQLQKQHPFQVYQLRVHNIVQWFKARWATDNLEEAVVQRGFSDLDAFLSRARHYYLYDKAHADLPPLLLQRP